MSLRARLLVATAVIAVVALVAADIATYAALRSSLYGQIDTGLSLSEQAVAASIGAPAGSSPSMQPGALPQSCPELDGAHVGTGGLTPGTVIVVRDAGGATVYHCTIAAFGVGSGHGPLLAHRITGVPAVRPGSAAQPLYFDAPSTSGGGSYRVAVVELADGRVEGDQLIVAVPLSGTSKTLSTLRDLELVVSAGAIVVALALGWWLVRLGLRPLRDVERTADAIAAGQLTERVRGDQARTEVGRLARALNVMLERIEGAFAERDRKEDALRTSEERMRRFVADASHELRTPLAAVQAYAELFERGAAERPDDLRRVLLGIRSESSRMGHLVEELLLLARLDEGRALQLQPVDLVAVAGEAAATAAALGPTWPVRLVAEQPVELEGDALRLRQVVDNLLGNVRVHCPPGTTATVTVRDERDHATITVADDGPGLSAEESRRVFERFFRADPSRSRHQGGSGLGLAIVDAIVRAHGGAVTIEAAPGRGATFTVRLPRQAAVGDRGAGPGAASATP